jgi:NAD-dependent SIR2 family protein deacetylase
MYNLLNIYDCPKCGKRLSDEVEFIEVQTSHDDWEKIPFCNKCHSEAKIRMHIDPETKQEIFHYEEVDDERARWAHGFYDESDEDDFDDED